MHDEISLLSEWTREQESVPYSNSHSLSDVCEDDEVEDVEVEEDVEDDADDDEEEAKIPLITSRIL